MIVQPRHIAAQCGQQATGIEDALENAAGVRFLGNNGGRGLRFSIRGFDAPPVLRDGFLLPTFIGDAAEPEVANLERIEVLRGPASVLYGQTEPGGVINLVTKHDYYAELTQHNGHFDHSKGLERTVRGPSL